MACGDAAKVAALVGEALAERELDDLLGDLAEPSARGLVVAYAALDHRRWISGERPVRPFVSLALRDAQAALAGGASLQVNGIEHVSGGAFAPAAALGHLLLAEAGLFGELGLGLTWSPAGARFAAHVDPAGACFLQLRGRKRYRFSARPWLDPESKGHLFADGALRFTSDLHDPAPEYVAPPGDAPMLERDLGPGDVLYVPAGTLHETEALSDCAALLFMWMEHDVATLVTDVLRRAHAGDARWRRLPAAPGGRFDLPEAVAARLGECLADVRRLASGSSDPAWARAYQARIAGAAGVDVPAAEAGASVALTSSARVRVVNAGGVAFVYAGADELELPPPWPELLARLRRAPASLEELAQASGLSLEELGDGLALLAARGAVTWR